MHATPGLSRCAYAPASEVMKRASISMRRKVVPGGAARPLAFGYSRRLTCLALPRYLRGAPS